MELNSHGISPQGLFQNAFIDPYDRYLANVAVKYTPSDKERADAFMFNELVDGEKTGLGYKWIFQYRQLQQTRMQTLQNKLNTAFTALLDRAFAANGAARAGSVPLLRNYWQLWQVATLPTNMYLADGAGDPLFNTGTGVRTAANGFYNSTFAAGSASVLGGANMKALPVRDVVFEVSNGTHTTVQPIGQVGYAPSLSKDNLYTNTTPGPSPPTPAPPPMGENLFLKALYDAFTRDDMQELFSESSHSNNQDLFREVFVGGSATDAFGSSLTASLLLSFETHGTKPVLSGGTYVLGPDTTTTMSIHFNKAVAFYHS